MIYILMIWTAVAASDSRGGPLRVYQDWRPVGEFHESIDSKPAEQMCKEAAQQLGLKVEKYRCIRSK